MAIINGLDRVLSVTALPGTPGMKLRPRPLRPRCAVRIEIQAATLFGHASEAIAPGVAAPIITLGPVAEPKS
ncbi:MAG TPA: hypothetical protein VKB96_18850, partial [Gammaproteobacteria bacterium]|nr:hypothetical protein [Gammaproteobacteria bacterium]